MGEIVAWQFFEIAGISILQKSYKCFTKRKSYYSDVLEFTKSILKSRY